MSKEQDFHKIIRRQNQEQQNNLWKKIEPQSEEEEIELGEVIRKKRINNKTFLVICASAILLILCIGLILGLTLPHKNPPFDEGIRYCVSGDYYSVETETSIAEYSNEHNLKLLYFDWYTEAEFVADKQFKLNETDEVICLKQELLDLNGYFIDFYIADDKTEIDFLSVFKDSCSLSEEINGTKLNWIPSKSEVYAWFNYDNYNYYIILLTKTNQEYIFDVAEMLLH